jgi:hypothetical protein
MQPLSQLELDTMRSTLNAVLTTDVEVWRRTSTVDPGGGEIDTWSKVHDYKCLFYSGSTQGRGGSEQATNNNIIITTTDFVFYFPVDSDIHRQDHLMIGVRTFNVEQVGGGTDGILIGLLVRGNEIT